MKAYPYIHILLKPMTEYKRDFYINSHRAVKTYKCLLSSIWLFKEALTLFEVVIVTNSTCFTYSFFYLFIQFLVRAYYMHGTVLEEMKNVKMYRIHFPLS